MQELFKIQKIIPEIKNKKYFLENKDNSYFNPKYLGERKEKEFYPSPLFLEILSSNLSSLTLNKRSSWFFSLGRDFSQKEVTKEEKGKIPIKTFIVRNGYNEILGIAEKKGNGYVNLFDIGHFLRREKNQ